MCLDTVYHHAPTRTTLGATDDKQIRRPVPTVPSVGAEVAGGGFNRQVGAVAVVGIHGPRFSGDHDLV